MRTVASALAASFSLASALGLAACAAGPDYRKPDVPLTSSYVAGAAIAAAPVTPEVWWHGFQDPGLARVIERALAQNLDLAQAQARVIQARAAAQAAGAKLAPQVEATGAATRTRQSLRSPIGEVADGVGADRIYTDTSVGVQASWELDVFGGLHRGREAARAQAQAAELTAAAVRISVAAETADAYLALRGLQARLAVAAHQEQVQARLLELVQRRANEGLSSDRELQRSVGALEGVRVSIPPLQAAIDGQLNRLDVLMGAQAGTYRDELASASVIPSAPQPSGSLMPSDLLRRRPDVVAAERQLAAANARIGMALAEYYPHVTLGGTLGFASLSPGNLFASEAGQAQGLVGLRWRLLDFGRVDAEVAAARGREAEALAFYRAAILRAGEDVESALSRYVHSDVESKALERQITALRIARQQTQTAYEGGVVGLIDVLDADRALLAASDQFATARATTARASVASFRALGGGWNE